MSDRIGSWGIWRPKFFIIIQVTIFIISFCGVAHCPDGGDHYHQRMMLRDRLKLLGWFYQIKSNNIHMNASTCLFPLELYLYSVFLVSVDHSKPLYTTVKTFTLLQFAFTHSQIHIYTDGVALAAVSASQTECCSSTLWHVHNDEVIEKVSETSNSRKCKTWCKYETIIKLLMRFIAVRFIGDSSLNSYVILNKYNLLCFSPKWIEPGWKCLTWAELAGPLGNIGKR